MNPTFVRVHLLGATINTNSQKQPTNEKATEVFTIKSNAQHFCIALSTHETSIHPISFGMNIKTTYF
ncbi:MAG: hypothetical protein ACTTJV_06600 [Ottowia sp.]